MEIRSDFFGKSLLTLMEYTPDEIAYFIDWAIELKRQKRAGIHNYYLKDKNIAMIFEKESIFEDEDRVLFENDDEEADRPSRRRKEERAAAKEEAAARRRPKMELEELAYRAPEKRRPRAEYEEKAPEKRRSRAMRDEEEMEVRRERNQRRAKYEEEYEQFKATKPAASAAAAAAAAQKKNPTRAPADPFAEWEKASAKVAEEQYSSPAAKAANIAPKAAEPVVEAPAPVKEKPVISDSFDLDDILNEFK